VAFWIFPLPWSAMRQTFGCLLPQLLAVQTSPRRFTRQTFLCLALASCVSGTNGDRHHSSVDLAILTSLASLADFALLEDFLLDTRWPCRTRWTLSMRDSATSAMRG
jgi:hypothetical protein